jgi:hypothetical protein
MKASKKWQRHIAHWEKSGINKRQYCKSRNLSYHSFLYHYKKFASAPQETGFRQVILQHEALSERIELTHVDGRRVSFPLSTPPEVMTILMSL